MLLEYWNAFFKEGLSWPLKQTSPALNISLSVRKLVTLNFFFHYWEQEVSEGDKSVEYGGCQTICNPHSLVTAIVTADFRAGEAHMLSAFYA